METQKLPLVSVIVPVYGVEEFLPRCLDSILSQTYENIQILLVDDGSPDKCPAICDEYGKKDPRIQVIHQKNGGVAKARNAGLLLVQGKYVTFCDSDDALEPDWIQAMADAAEISGAEVVVCNHRKIFPDGREQTSRHEQGRFPMESPEDRLRYMIHYVLSEPHGWEITTRLFCADIIRKNGIRFCEECHNFAEDLSFLLHYSLFVSRAICIPQWGYLYYVRDDSMMSKSKDQVRMDDLNTVSLRFQDQLQSRENADLFHRYSPVFHYMVMREQYTAAIRCGNYRHIGSFLEPIRQEKAWRELTEGIFACRPLLTELFGEIPAGRIVIFSRYLLHRNYLRFKIERFLFLKKMHFKD